MTKFDAIPFPRIDPVLTERSSPRESSIRTLQLIAFCVFLPFGCEHQADAPELFPAEKEPSDSVDVDTIIEQAISAMGGEQGRSFLQRGSVAMKVVGRLEELSQEFGTDTLTFKAQFDLPKFERRVVYGDPEKARQIFITNSGKLWIGDENGVGRTIPAPPQEMYQGPLLIGLVQNAMELKKIYSKLELLEENSASSVFIVGGYVDDDLAVRIDFDKQTHLPVRAERFSTGLLDANLRSQTLTVTSYLDYKQFGSATLPTTVTVEQYGTKTLEITLVDADFDSPISKSLFEIPE